MPVIHKDDHRRSPPGPHTCFFPQSDEEKVLSAESSVNPFTLFGFKPPLGLEENFPGLNPMFYKDTEAQSRERQSASRHSEPEGGQRLLRGAVRRQLRLGESSGPTTVECHYTGPTVEAPPSALMKRRAGPPFPAWDALCIPMVSAPSPEGRGAALDSPGPTPAHSYILLHSVLSHGQRPRLSLPSRPSS